MQRFRMFWDSLQAWGYGETPPSFPAPRLPFWEKGLGDEGQFLTSHIVSSKLDYRTRGLSRLATEIMCSCNLANQYQTSSKYSVN